MEKKELIEKLADALRLTTLVLESYQMDIQNPPECFFGKLPDLVALGFCQGTIYLKSAPRALAVMEEYERFKKTQEDTVNEGR